MTANKELLEIDDDTLDRSLIPESVQDAHRNALQLQFVL